MYFRKNSFYNRLFAEALDEAKSVAHDRFHVCPACGGDVIYIYDIYTPDIIKAIRDNRLLALYMTESDIHGFWECQRCGRLWGMGTTLPIFELR